MGTRMWRYSNVLESTSMQSRALLCNVIPRHSRLFCATCLSDRHASQIHARKAWLLLPRLPFHVSDWLSRSCGTILPSYLCSSVCARLKILRSIQARRMSHVLEIRTCVPLCVRLKWCFWKGSTLLKNDQSMITFG